MHRVRKVAQGSVGDSLRNNIDGQTGEQNISIAGETVAYESRKRKREKKENINFSISFSLNSSFNFTYLMLYKIFFK